MNIYKVWTTDTKQGYDDYTSFTCLATNASRAKHLSPFKNPCAKRPYYRHSLDSYGWVKSFRHVRVMHIGTATANLSTQVLNAS